MSWAMGVGLGPDQEALPSLPPVLTNSDAVGSGVLIVALDSEPMTVIVICGGVVAAVTLIWVGVVMRRLKRRLREISKGVEQFSAGRLDHQIGKASGDSTELTRSLNQMAKNLQERIDLLKAQLGEQRIIHESMSTGMVAVDLEQRILSVNRAAERMLGLREKLAKGRSLRDALQEPELNLFVSKAVAEAKPTSAEFTLVRPRGATVHVAGEPLRGEGNKPVGVLMLISDVTRLRKLESLRSDFAANVSHELRTPITNIQGYVETLLQVGTKNPVETTKFLEIIKRNTDRLAHIIEDLLALARLERPEMSAAVERSMTGLTPLLDSVIEEFEPAWTEKGIKIRCEVNGDLSANVAAPLIEQAVGNLLSNAIKYSPPGSAITISAKEVEGGQSVEISVSDQGPGIAAEHLPRIFERFYRVDRARSRQLGGTGLGLAIVKHIALVHGGRVDVESKPGRGSVFRIVVPRQ
ncbi:MAG: ATP-binding protein [Phycisphaerales bacterium]|nr:ATP-binding protein [Phycisphaerales bacterium]MCI0631529.1 ATP-binding protein [Phycisphaerales bacterium]